ncbi:MAG: class I SAM-dependent methyltransferase [Gammaproteobacteria bacterium]|nr:class I SAM-dependent methyltransferase [Gammaproteobacteria bacterium]
MEDGRHSYMAESSAYLRAVHMVLDGEPKILNDPLAAKLLGPGLDAKIAADQERLTSKPLIKARALIIMRSRYVEDELLAAIDRGVTQYVILGAGLDTSPYMSGHPAEKLRTYEVDHPDTQKLKLERLAEAGVQMPENLRHVPVDFERESLAEVLAGAGFDPNQPAFFSWLGVSYYLRLESVLDVFKYVASVAPSSQLVFDFVMADSALGEAERKAIARITAFVEKYSEPWFSRFEPQELQDTLHSVGFSDTFYLSWERATERYFKDRSDELHLDFTTQIMSAIV